MSKLFRIFILIFLFVGCAYNTQAVEYGSPLKHEPYVQLGDAPLTGYGDSAHDQFELLWQTIPGVGTSTDSFVVEYKLSSEPTTWTDAGAISTITTNVESRINHYVNITGLTYNTDYDYRVKHIRNGSTLATYSATYHTRLAAGDTTPYTFVAYGDSASGNPPTNFISVQSRINTINPAFSILLGDNAYTDGTHSEWDLRLQRSINSTAADYIKSKIDYFGWGNHDIVNNSGQPVMDNYDSPKPVLNVTSPVAAPVGETPEHNYSFDYGNVHFVTIDTNSYTSSSRLAAQLTWAIADLNASAAKWKVVFVHFPIVSISFTSTGPTSNYYQQMVSQLKAAGVDILFVGHAHVYERSFPLTGQSGSTVLYTDSNDNDYAKGAGLTEVVSGLGGRDFHTGNTTPGWLAFARTGNTATVATYGVTKIDVTTNSLTVTQVQASNGATIDQFTITSGISGTNVQPAALTAGTTGNAVVSFTSSTAIPANGKIVVTLPTSLGAGFVASSTGTTVSASSGLDGTLTASVSGNVVTITRSGGTSSSAGVKSITLTNIKNPDITGSTGVYGIKTTDSANATLEEDAAVAADTITAGSMTSTNIQPASLVSSTTTTATVAFTTTNPLPANGKIVLTFPTSLAGGFGFNAGGSSAASSITGIDGTLSVSVASNVVTLTRSGGTSFASGAIGFTLSNISNPPTGGSTGVYDIKTTNSSGTTIDQDSAVSADTITAGAPSSWWNSSWHKRIRVTFTTTGIATNATNVPVMVALDGGRLDYADTLAAGADVRFVDSDNATVLSHEIEKWNSSGTSTIWVKVPQIDGASTTDFIYMYYNNTGASDGQSVAAVWSNGYQAVYHFNETSGAYKDSVSNYVSNSSDGNTVTSRSTTLLGNAPTFGGTTASFITVPDADTFNVTNDTIEAFIKPAGAGTSIQSGSAALTAAYPIVTKGMAEGESTAADIHFFLGLNSSSTIGSDFEDPANTSSNAPISGSTVLSTGGTTAYYVASTVVAGSGGSHKVYVNGVQDGTTVLPVSGLTAITPNTAGTQKLGIGTGIKTDNSINGGFNGIIDEVRISSVTRTADWLLLQNKSIRDTLNTFGSAEDVSGATSLTGATVVPASLVTNASGNVVVSFTTATTIPTDGKILITFPTSLGSGFVFDSNGTTTVVATTSLDGVLTVSTSSNSITITRSGGTASAAGAKSITLSHIANPGVVGSTGTFSIQTRTSSDATLDQALSVAAQTIVAGTLLGTNVEPSSPVLSTAGNVTLTFTTVSGIPSNGKIVATFPTSLGSGFTFNSGGSTAATSHTIGGSLSVGIVGNVITLTRSGGSATTGGETESITLSNVLNPNAAGSTGVYQLKTTDSAGLTIDQDTAVTADTISSSGVSSGWWNSSWLYRKKITFNNASQPANLVNFPVRVTLSTSTTTYGNFKSNGDDVRFVDADGSTVLNYEIENWTTASTSNMWVKVPQIDSASTTDFIYMYYGNTGATAVATTTGVWDSNYITVLHFASTTATNYTDSTSYGHNSDAINSTTRAFVTGAAGNAATFSGANGTSNITLPDSADYDMTSHTNEAYIKKVGASVATISTGSGGQTAIDPILTKGMAEAETTAADVQFFMGVTSGGFIGADFENSVLAGGTSQNAPVTGTSTVTAGTWYHVADRFDDTAHTFRVYKNGNREFSSTTAASYHPSTGGTMKVGIAVGAKTTGLVSGGGFNGTIDEVRISNIARSEEWIAASNLSVTDTYNTYATEESQGAGALTSTNVEPASLSASASGNVTATFTTVNALASDGKIVITLPTSLGTGFVASSTGTTVSASSGFDGSLTASVSGNIITITRSGGTSSTAGIKSITLSNIRNPNAPGSTGTYQIKTTTSAGVTVDQDLAVAADTIISASLSSSSVTPASLSTAASGNATIAFTTTNSIPVNGKIVITFPTSLGSGFTLGTPTVVSASGINGVFTVSTSSNVLTLTRTGTGNVSSAGAKSIVVSGITNPNTAGNTGTYQIKTTNSSDATIDQDTSVASSDIVGALSGNNVQPASLVAGASGNVVVTFTTAAAIPSTGKIVVTFPTALGGFTFDNGGTTAIGASSGLDGSLTVSTSSNTITITRSGGTSSSAGVKSITLSNIKNPVIPGSTGVYSISTKTATNVILEQDANVASDTLTEGTLTSTNVQPASLVASASGDITVTFTTTNPIPSDGRISIYLPISLGDGFIVDDGGTTAISAISGFNGTVTLSDVNNFVTIQRNGDGATSTPGVVSFTLSHIKNPNIAGSTEEYTIQTQTASAITIDQDMLVAADTITPIPDTTAPVISSIASTTSSTTASFTWTTNEAASSSVRYGLTTSYGTTASSSATSSHSAAISGLTSDTLYHFQVLAIDASGNISTSSDQTFTTGDGTPPIISTIASSTNVATATISWTTNEAASSSIEYGLTTSYGTVASSSATSSHTVSLSGLTDATTYHFRVFARDVFGNVSTSTDRTFVTVNGADITPPVISSIASSTAPTTATVTWTTNEAASSSVRYGLTTSYGSVASSSATLSHTANLSSLTPNTLYHYQVLAIDASGNISTSSDQTFTTPAAPDTTAPVISAVASSTGITTATITWTTDENASSTLVYGATTSYGSASSTTAFVTSQSISLTGLTAATTYHFRLVSSDSANNIVTSSDYTFTTLVAPDTTAPVISSIASSTTETGSIITWITDEPSTSQVEYGLTSSYTASTTFDASATTTHSVAISGLITNTIYHFRVMSQDASVNFAASTDKTFKTIVDTTAPAISSVSSSNLSTTAQTITWTTDENSTSVVTYGLTSSYVATTTVSTPTTAHSVDVTDLKSCTQYHYKVLSVDGSGNGTYSVDTTFITDGCAGNSDVEAVNTVAIDNSTGANATTTSTTTGNTIGLVVPAGFSTTSAVFQIKRIEDAAVISGTGGVAGMNIIGDQAYDLQAYITSTTTVTAFNATLTISMSYRDADVVGYDESSLRIYTYNGSSWSILPNCIVDAVQNIVTCETTHFSTFGLYGTPVVVSSGGSSGSSSGGGNGGGSTVPYSYTPSTTPVVTTNTVVATTSTSVALRYVFTQDLKLGSKGPEVKMLQRFLNNNNYPIAKSGVGSKGKETDLFGKATEAALKQFQLAYKTTVIIPAGLTKPNGVVGPQTRRLLNTGTFIWIPMSYGITPNTAVLPIANSTTGQLFTKQLSLGTVSPEVKTLQEFLNTHGFTVAISGIGSVGRENQSYGPATKSAVIKFQLKYGIVKSSKDTGYGVVGPATRLKLNELLMKSL